MAQLAMEHMSHQSVDKSHNLAPMPKTFDNVKELNEMIETENNFEDDQENLAFRPGQMDEVQLIPSTSRSARQRANQKINPCYRIICLIFCC